MDGLMQGSNDVAGINHVYYLLLQDENQREVHLQGRFGNQAQGKWFPGQAPRGYPPQRVRNVRRKKFKTNVTCSYCLKLGYVEQDCYRLIGYPKEYQPKEFSGNIMGNTAIGDEDYGVGEFDESIID
ncbi:hypothetical protein KY290_031512 [Solanum tuberosum]|uniref:Gag-pol polyprotein n=1 Tax=Solanum tuberosum TaxID=4113 RepID=A0ABQ7UA48_SOLTU|nr:hypothetical protein KY284_030560 [Solanum tuberosum]KAH0657116.1 hypothetical protein KY285_031998 [Solanum tuberosum]KAH0743519.1 hypothetical protein KY290_031512 [Solanum tuberosum]